MLIYLRNLVLIYRRRFRYRQRRILAERRPAPVESPDEVVAAGTVEN